MPPCPPLVHFLIHSLSSHIFLSSPLFLTREEAVQDCERSGTCWCVSLCSSIRPGHQSHFILLQRSSHTADVRLSQGTHTHKYTSRSFKCSLAEVDCVSPCHLMPHVFYFLLLCLRWQIWQCSIWQVDLSTCENLMWAAVFFSQIALSDTWRGSVLLSAPSRWPAATTSPSRTQT